MKVRILFLMLFGFLFIQCDNKSKEEVIVGEITEKAPREAAVLDPNLAPTFAFNSIEGEPIALEDLKGKYVYVDIWATWCGPCLVQIPAMKEMEEKYRDKDIEFVSISIDADNAKTKWENMIRDKEMSGIHLWSGRDPNFLRNYKIKTIPRFLLIGKDGELISDNAPRPMNHQTRRLNSQLESLFDELLNENHS